ncbi:hypothetical protein V6329_22845, partial [Enterobacter hormaechei]
MSATRIQAVYRDTGVEAYRDNPFIEALPPLQESVNSAASLKSSLQLTSSDLQKSRVIRVKWFTEFGHLNRGDMLTSEQHRCHN